MLRVKQHFTTDLRVPQQLHNPTLIWRESNDLPDDRAHELGFGGLDALALAGTHGLFDGGGGVAVVEAATEVYRTESQRVNTDQAYVRRR